MYWSGINENAFCVHDSMTQRFVNSLKWRIEKLIITSAPLRYPEHVLRKIHHCTFPRKISRRPFLGFYPKNVYIFSLKNSDDLFFSHRPFSRRCYTPSPPSMHSPTCCFTRFYTLLYALVTINTP